MFRFMQLKRQQESLVNEDAPKATLTLMAYSSSQIFTLGVSQGMQIGDCDLVLNSSKRQNYVIVSTAPSETQLPCFSVWPR